jgi:two-component system osmolarity sensor histidine kinase EnvZ
VSKTSAPSLSQKIRQLLPHSLLARSLLIMLIPLLIAQAVAFELSYGRNLNFVSRRFSQSVGGEIAQAIGLLARYRTPADQSWIIKSELEHNYLIVSIAPDQRLIPKQRVDQPGPEDDDLAASLRGAIPGPTNMDWTSDPINVVVTTQLGPDVVTVKVPRKRLVDSTLVLFPAWVSGTSLVMYLIAALFMRNQVRAIHRLARAADSFGRGQDRGPIKLEGATEVRLAAAAFNLMQERIRRFLTQRTEMLAGVSHDLRTPLTRLRLAIAMLPDQGPDTADMTADLEEMDRMIAAYLAFARGDGEEQPQTVDLDTMLDDIAAAARRAGARIERGPPAGIAIKARPDALRRAITNVTDNAARHGTQVVIGATSTERGVHILIDDNGPGMPEHQREAAFRAFTSNAAGGTGLGLTIARDIVRSHGGDITLETSPMGGLRARIRLPV